MNHEYPHDDDIWSQQMDEFDETGFQITNQQYERESGKNDHFL